MWIYSQKRINKNGEYMKYICTREILKNVENFHKTDLFLFHIFYNFYFVLFTIFVSEDKSGFILFISKFLFCFYAEYVNSKLLDSSVKYQNDYFRDIVTCHWACSTQNFANLKLEILKQ